MKKFFLKTIKSSAFMTGLVFIIPILLFASLMGGYFSAAHPLLRATLFRCNSEQDLEIYKNIHTDNEGGSYQISDNWILSNGILSLPADQTGTIKIRWGKHPGTKFFADIFIDHYPDTKITAEIDDDGTTKTINLKKNSNNFFNWTKYSTEKNSFYMKIIAAAGSQREINPVIKYINLKSFHPDTLRIVPWYGILMLILTGLIWQRFVKYAEISEKMKKSGWIIWSLALVIFRIFPVLFQYTFPIYIIFSAIMIYAAYLKTNKKCAGLFAMIIFGLILLIGFYLRWNALILFERTKLEYDAEDYFNIATKYSKGLFDTAAPRAPYIREPLYIWIIKTAFIVMPHTENALKMVSLLISIASITAIYIFGARNFGYLIALGTSFFIAASTLFVNFAVQGLREELFMFTITLFLYYLLKKEKGIWHGIFTGLAGASVLLVRVQSFTFIFPILLIFAILRKWSIKNILISFLLPVILIIPHLIFNYNFHDSKDIFYSGKMHTTFYRNLEFAGKPGYPTIEEVRKDPYTRPESSSFQYLFKEHTPGQIIKGMFRGGVRIFFTVFTYKILFSENNILLFIYIAGMTGLLFSKERWLIVIYFFLSFPVLYLANSTITERLTLYIAPFQIFGMFAGLKRFGLYVKGISSK